MARQEFSVPNLMARITDEAAAYEFLEELRWDGQPACSHCGSIAAHYFLTPANGKDRATRTGAPSQRRVWKCKDCRKQFSVLTGTVMHGTKISVRTWVMVLLEMCASKNGVSAREIERKYDLTAKSAWFLLQRIREAMKRDPLSALLSGTIIADETWIGGKDSNRHTDKRRRPGTGHTDKQPVMVLVDYETRESRARVIRNVTGETLGRVLTDEVDVAASQLWTDESASYRTIGKPFGDHRTVNHGEGEYKREGASTNVAEGYFSQLQAQHRRHAPPGQRRAPGPLPGPVRLPLHPLPPHRLRAPADAGGQVGGRRLTYKPLVGRA